MKSKPFPKILKAKALKRHNHQKGLRELLKAHYYQFLLQCLWETETEA